MNKSTEESFEEILDNVRAIIRTNAPTTIAIDLIKEINNYEDSILSDLSFTLEQK